MLTGNTTSQHPTSPPAPLLAEPGSLQLAEGGQDAEPGPLTSALLSLLQPEDQARSALFVTAHAAGDQTDLIRHLQIRL